MLKQWNGSWKVDTQTQHRHTHRERHIDKDTTNVHVFIEVGWLANRVRREKKERREKYKIHKILWVIPFFVGSYCMALATSLSLSLVCPSHSLLIFVLCALVLRFIFLGMFASRSQFVCASFFLRSFFMPLVVPSTKCFRFFFYSLLFGTFVHIL